MSDLSIHDPGVDEDALPRRLDELARAMAALEPDADERRRLRDAVEAVAERFTRDVDTLPAYVETADPAIRLLESPIGEEGIALEAVMEHVERDVLRPGGNPASPAHLAYIPGGPLFHAALGDYLAAVTNKYAGIFFTGPGPVRMENMLIRWVADLVGYPAEAGGSIASGGSLANLAAVVAARDAHGLRGAGFATTAAYVTHQAHHSVQKALRIAGLGEVRLRYVPTDERFRMRPDALARAVAEDRAAGLTPWLIVAAAGTTDTGAVDPLDAIADVAEREGCWLHVDAAYGGFFLLTEEGRRLLRGIERSHSAVLDPHKSLFLPWGSGVVVVRDARALAAAHAYEGNYMQDALRAPGEISPADLSPELSKPFRALRMWLPLVLLGTRPFEAALEEKLLLARWFHQQIQAAGFEAGPPPELSVVTFRWARPGMALEAENRVNAEIVDRMRRDGRVFLSSTLLDGRFTIRMAALQFRTHRRHIDLAVRLLRETALAVGAELA